MLKNALSVALLLSATVSVGTTYVRWSHLSGAPNKNIVQNHLNIELLNVF